MRAGMADVPEISVVSPCHNERENLAALVMTTCAAIEPTGRTFEIVLVDDCSTDGSWELLRQMGLKDSRVRALRFEYNCGQSAALWAGMKAAQGKVIVTLDSDLQNPPAEIPRFLEALKDFDCVCGNRKDARAMGDSWLRRASSAIANGVRNKLSGETIADAGCCFRAFRQECIAGVKFFKGGHRFLPTLIKMEGFTVGEIPISHNARNSGQSHYGIWNRMFKSFVDLLAVRWMKNRLIRYEFMERFH